MDTVSSPTIIQQSPAWEEYPKKVLDQEKELHSDTKLVRMQLVNLSNNSADARQEKFADRIARAHEDTVTKVSDTLSQNRMSDQELALALMQSWEPGLDYALVEATLQHRMDLLKRYSNTRPTGDPTKPTGLVPGR